MPDKIQSAPRGCDAGRLIDRTADPCPHPAAHPAYHLVGGAGWLLSVTYHLCAHHAQRWAGRYDIPDKGGQHE